MKKKASDELGLSKLSSANAVQVAETFLGAPGAMLAAGKGKRGKVLAGTGLGGLVGLGLGNAANKIFNIKNKHILPGILGAVGTNLGAVASLGKHASDELGLSKLR